MLTEHEDERLSSIYWLSTPMAEESDQEVEKVSLNFSPSVMADLGYFRWSVTWMT
jgi:hypothetical protein